MNVSDLMSREVVSLQASESLDLAHDIMQLGRIRHMPILEGGRLVGILSQRDLFRAAVSSVLKVSPSAEREWLGRVRVADVMTSAVVTAEPGESIGAAVERMLDKRIGCLVVVKDGKLAGLLSESDCLRYLKHALENEATKTLQTGETT